MRTRRAIVTATVAATLVALSLAPKSAGVVRADGSPLPAHALADGSPLPAHVLADGSPLPALSF